MPTIKPRPGIIFSDEEMNYLEVLWAELRSPGLRGTPLYAGRGRSPNQWIAKLAMERAAQVREEYDRFIKERTSAVGQKAIRVPRRQNHAK